MERLGEKKGKKDEECKLREDGEDKENERGLRMKNVREMRGFKG